MEDLRNTLGASAASRNLVPSPSTPPAVPPHDPQVPLVGTEEQPLADAARGVLEDHLTNVERDLSRGL